MDDLIVVASQVGFPIAVSSYLLIKFQSVLEKQNSQLERITVILEGLIKK